MSEKQPQHKSDHAVQAQIAAFAEARIDSYGEHKRLLNSIGRLALGPVKDVVRTTKSVEYVDAMKAEDNPQGRVEAGTEIDVASGDDYIAYLREVGGHKHEAITGRVKILEAYDEFKPVVEALRSEFDDSIPRKSHARHLGSGSNADVFAVTVDDTEYAVRVPIGGSVKASEIDMHIGGALLAKGVPHLEQIVAASYEDGVTVAEMMPGAEAGELTSDQVEQITDEQLNDFIDTIIDANERGIEIDPKPSNVFYDTEQGFGIVDISSSELLSKNSADQTAAKNVGILSVPLANMQLYGKVNPSQTIDEYLAEGQALERNVGVMKRYRALVAEKFDGRADQRECLDIIDERIKMTENMADERSTKDKVEQIVAQDQERAERARQRQSQQKGNSIRLDEV